MPSTQGVYWLLTIPFDDWQRPDTLDDAVAYLRGQAETGGETGYRHWQLLVVFRRTTRLAAVKRIFGERAHCELSRSRAADTYVWKQETRIAGTDFELGTKPVRRNSAADWAKVRECAKRGDLDGVPDDIFVRHYSNLRRIAADHAQPVAMRRRVHVFWGVTGSGKSHAAWNAAGPQAYDKDARSKFWEGYEAQRKVVIDEFRGGIDIAHILRWTDRYPRRVDIKFSSRPLCADEFWITSNIHPRDWYPDLDLGTYQALERRFTDVTHFAEPYVEPEPETIVVTDE